MHYLNANRKNGLSGLMRVKNDALTLAQSIDSCIDALDELIITYHECTDGSVQIIENKKLQYPDKILVIPYPYHVIGVGATDEEYEYAKTLPAGHPQLLATYYNNALQYVNYKYVVKIDADQIYFTQALLNLRNLIVNGVQQNKLASLCGKFINEVYCQRRGNRRIWSKYHPLHYLQYILIPLFRKQYVEYAVSELLKGDGYLSLSGVNVLRYNNRWFSLLGCNMNGIVLPYNGFGDHLVFEADEYTEYLPWDYQWRNSSKRVLIERFVFLEEKTLFLLGFYWFHLKPMKNSNAYLSCFSEGVGTRFPVNRLGEVSSNSFIKCLNKGKDFLAYWEYRNYFNFVHNLDKKAIKSNLTLLNGFIE